MTNDLTTNSKVKVTKAILLLGILFVFSSIFAITESYPDYSSAYDLGYLTGKMFGQMIKNFVFLSLGVQAFRYLK